MTYLRLKKDIVDIMKNPLNDNGIYYLHDETNFLKGNILMCGPSDTPYEYGFYFFTILFPENYPVSPPTVTFYNKDSTYNTRFNPNLYRNGKVCISVLNTWRGEGWTSCLTLRSVLLSILTVLNQNPLINEPNISITHPSVIPYNNVIAYRNIHVCIYDIINKIINYPVTSPNIFLLFKSVIKKVFLENYDKIIEKINRVKNIKTIKDSVQIVNMYNMNCTINYDALEENIKKIKIELENNK
jgi:ubiquitin-conjugating enzyme E2 Z